jgi:hypothetical protein
MRSPAELSFRFRQEAANLFYFLRPPQWKGGEPARLSLPPLPAARLPFAVEPAPVRWRRDPQSGVESPLSYFRLIPYLDASRAGDHKAIWDRNRHQELPLLAAQSNHSLVQSLLTDWMTDNPVHRGMNWTSALEVAFRALSWLYLWHTPGFPPPPRFLDFLFAHGTHLRHNLSVYFSPNTHLLGEAVALHALGLFFRQEDWRSRGREIVFDCLRDQVFPDGAYFEQSSYYHVYALDFFLLHHALEALPESVRPAVDKMALYLNALMGEARLLPFLGDDDGGRLYHPFDEAERFGLHTLAQWPAPGPPPDAFPDAGIYFLSNSETQILFDAGAFARGSAGHSHSDTLQVLVRVAGEEVLIDPGTYTYVGDASQRQLFRGAAMHNTIRCDEQDQAIPAGPFRWLHTPQVRTLSFRPPEAVAEYRTRSGFLHRRLVRWRSTEQLLDIEDSLDGPPGEHRIEQFWHFGSESALGRLHCEDQPGFSLRPRPEFSFRSRRFGQREHAPALCFEGQAKFPLKLCTRLNLAPGAKIPS